MAVTVSKADRNVDEHETGRGIFVKDGHLTVGDNQNAQFAKVIAIYAPGQWRDATIGGE